MSDVAHGMFNAIWVLARRRLRHPYVLRARAAVLSWYFRRRHVGTGSHIDRTAHVLGWRSVRIGEHSIVSADCWLNVNDLPNGSPQITVGDFCFIGRRNMLSSGRLLRLGDYCLTGPDCRFLGSDHIFDDPFMPYVSTGATKEGVIELGANCWLGAGVAIVGNVKIGHGSVVGAMTLVNKDVPPFSLVVGNPCKVIKRYDMGKRTWVAADQLSSDHERMLPDENAYVTILRGARPQVTMPRAAASKNMGDWP